MRVRLSELASQPGLTPAPAAPEPPEAPPEPAACAHDFRPFPLPAEGVGRVFQCSRCHAIGFRVNRYAPSASDLALSKAIRLYSCSRCKKVAVKRMFGRGQRGSYIWACQEHSVQIEGKQRPAP